VTIKHNDAAIAKDQLIVGDVVSYDVRMGQVASITVTKKLIPPVTGQFNLLDKVGKTIQYKDKEGKFGVQEMSDNVIVKIEGMTNVTLDDLFRGDAISMTMNDQGKVGIITITSRSVSFLNGVTVSNYLPDDNTLIVADSANKKSRLS